jgi:hypothetical protein
VGGGVRGGICISQKACVPPARDGWRESHGEGRPNALALDTVAHRAAAVPRPTVVQLVHARACLPAMIHPCRHRCRSAETARAPAGERRRFSTSSCVHCSSVRLCLWERCVECAGCRSLGFSVFVARAGSEYTVNTMRVYAETVLSAACDSPATLQVAGVTIETIYYYYSFGLTSTMYSVI